MTKGADPGIMITVVAIAGGLFLLSSLEAIIVHLVIAVCLYALAIVLTGNKLVSGVLTLVGFLGPVGLSIYGVILLLFAVGGRSTNLDS